MERLFTPAERWLGGLFGIWIELGDRAGEDSLTAVDALWAHPALDGPYPLRELEPWTQSRVDPRQFPEQEMCGVATLHDGARVPCKAHLFRGPPEDSITLDVPLNGLYAAWPHAIADDPDDTAGARLWQEPLSNGSPALPGTCSSRFDSAPRPSVTKLIRSTRPTYGTGSRAKYPRRVGTAF